ncbi:MAG: SHOCT domain-containing protein [Candidatus Tectimicrobiota bacterium]
MMQQLTPEGQQHVTALARRYGVSTDAVLTLLQALRQGQGTMAQFHHSELGGSGQWMAGGMVMLGDMFNQALKATVDGLCVALSTLLRSEVLQEPAAASLQAPAAAAGHPGAWWPADLGVPQTSGAQNTMRYAYFPDKRRLAVAVHGTVTVYDTLDHHLSGVSQQQGNGSTLSFTSQHGTVVLHDLPVMSSPPPGQPDAAAWPAVGAPEAASATSGRPERPHEAQVPLSNQAAPVPPATATPLTQPGDIFTALERLAELHQKGILSEEEFSTKKAELLRRI